MNTLAHLGATGALFWLSLYAFNTLSNGVLGVAVLAAASTYLVITIIGIADDDKALRILKGRWNDDSD